MTQPVAEADELVKRLAPRLDDVSVPLSALDLRRIVKELDVAIAKAPTASAQASLYSLRGTAFARQENDRAALAEFLKAARLAPGVAAFANDVAMAHLNLDELDAAEAWLKQADERAIRPEWLDFILAVNRCELHRRRHEPDAAARAFELATSRANPESSHHQFVLAGSAVELGREDDAVEFFARYLAALTGTSLDETSAIEFIRLHPAEVRDATADKPELVAAIEAVGARYDAPLPPEAQFPRELTLTPTGWDRLRGALEAPAAPTDELRRLLHGQRA